MKDGERLSLEQIRAFLGGSPGSRDARDKPLRGLLRTGLVSVADQTDNISRLAIRPSGCADSPPSVWQEPLESAVASGRIRTALPPGAAARVQPRMAASAKSLRTTPMRDPTAWQHRARSSSARWHPVADCSDRLRAGDRGTKVERSGANRQSPWGHRPGHSGNRPFRFTPRRVPSRCPLPVPIAPQHNKK
ncbi:MAG: hypothetical protein QOJ99_5333 [Bryobacterales bacterium]|jgi:hypothetical protein|nr:hypothetical protein [Bryobacterales bacterium]